MAVLRGPSEKRANRLFPIVGRARHVGLAIAEQADMSRAENRQRHLANAARERGLIGSL